MRLTLSTLNTGLAKSRFVLSQGVLSLKRGAKKPKNVDFRRVLLAIAVSGFIMSFASWHFMKPVRPALLSMTLPTPQASIAKRKAERPIAQAAITEQQAERSTAQASITKRPTIQAPAAEQQAERPIALAPAAKQQAERPAENPPASAPLAQAEAKPFHEDANWSRKYERTGDRKARFFAVAGKPALKSYWLHFKGGEYIDPKKLAQVTEIVMKRLPHIPKNAEVTKLITETAVAESLSGRYTASTGGDHGVFQIREEVAKGTLSWLKDNHEDVFASVMLFYDDARSLAQNLDANVPFGIAMAVSEYWRKAGPEFHRHIGSTRKRAIMWKSVYNTRLGKGTVADYEKRNADWKRIAANGVEELNKKLRPNPQNRVEKLNKKPKAKNEEQKPKGRESRKTVAMRGKQ